MSTGACLCVQVHLSALFGLWSPGAAAACARLLGEGQGESLTLCCTKSRGETHFFPRAGEGGERGKPWTLDGAYEGGRVVRGGGKG